MSVTSETSVKKLWVDQSWEDPKALHISSSIMEVQQLARYGYSA